MAAAILVGTLALPLDGPSPRTDRTCKINHTDMAPISLTKQEQHQHHLPLIIYGSRTGSGKRRGSNSSSSSKIGAAASSSGGGSSAGRGGGGGDWEEEFKRKMKDREDMRELEKRAEEMQNQVVEEVEGEATEEERRERVRRELEKV